MDDEPQRSGPDPSDGDAAGSGRAAPLAERVRPGDVAWGRPADLCGRVSVRRARRGGALLPPWRRRRGRRTRRCRCSGSSMLSAPVRRSRSVAIAFAAAAALILVVVAAALVVARDNGGDIVAEAHAEPLEPTSCGTAELLEHDGRYQLRVETADLDDDGCWSCRSRASVTAKMVRLAVAEQLYNIPTSISFTAFPVEHVRPAHDGDPAPSATACCGPATLTGDPSPLASWRCRPPRSRRRCR